MYYRYTYITKACQNENDSGCITLNLFSFLAALLNADSFSEFVYINTGYIYTKAYMDNYIQLYSGTHIQ